MKDACAQTADEEKGERGVVALPPPQVGPSCQAAELKSLHSKYGGFIYASIRLQRSELYGNLPFAILMTLQQSAVAERGREPGGFPSQRAESTLLAKKGAKSVCCDA